MVHLASTETSAATMTGWATLLVLVFYFTLSRCRAERSRDQQICYKKILKIS